MMLLLLLPWLQSDGVVCLPNPDNAAKGQQAATHLDEDGAEAKSLSMRIAG